MKAAIRRGLLIGLAVALTTGCEQAPITASQLGTTYPKANALAHRDKPYVLLISLDGYRYDYTDLYEPPNLRRFAREGVHSESLIPGYPSETFPNHYGIATGMYPGTHGIVANDFFDSERGARYSLGNIETVEDGSWYGGTPLWVAAEQQGMVTASYFWVGSEADVQSVRPTYYTPYDSSVPHMERIESVLEWLAYPNEYRPHLITLYFSAVDSAGHASGTSSPELQRAIEGLDSQLGSLFDGIETLDIDINVFVVSDHGMIDLDLASVVYLDDTVDLRGVRVIGSGAHSFLYIDAAQRRSEIYSDLKNQEDNYRVYRREDTPDYWHFTHDRVGDLVVEAQAPYAIRLRRMTGGLSAAAHGYDPHRYPEMQGIFYAKGPSLVEETTIPSFENAHIYPLIMELLGLEIPEEIDGSLSVLEGILQEPE
jgi:predicted AlkP superfamily pyrophosphatase or phosphodiesterase